MKPIAIANYTTPQAGFRQFIEPEQKQNILMICGEGGCGKSYLIEYCLQTAPQFPQVYIDLQSEVWGIDSLYGALVARMGWEAVPSFRRKVVQLVGEEGDSAEEMSARRLGRLLKRIGQQGDIETRQSWYRQLTEAWFDDVERFKRPLLVALDSYEQRSSEMDEWLRNEFLYEVAQAGPMRVVIGGRLLPEPTADWINQHQVYELGGVPEPEPWLIWAKQIRIQDLTERTMINLCEQMEGDPVKITQFLEIFPRAAEEAETAAVAMGENGKSARQIKKEMRKRLRQNMVEKFTVNELHTLCFDLDINHELLPEYKELRGYVRELIRYAESNGLLAELVEGCAEVYADVVWEAYV